MSKLVGVAGGRVVCMVLQVEQGSWVLWRFGRYCGGMCCDHGERCLFLIIATE